MFRSGLVNLEKQIIFYSFKNNHDYAIVLVFEQNLTVYFAGANYLAWTALASRKNNCLVAQTQAYHHASDPCLK